MAASQVEGFSSNPYSPVFVAASVVRTSSPPPRCRSAPHHRLSAGPVRFCHCNLPAERHRVHTEGLNPDRWILTCPRVDPPVRCSFLLRQSDLVPNSSYTNIIPNQAASSIDIDSSAHHTHQSGRMRSQFHSHPLPTASSVSSLSDSGPSPLAGPPPPAPNPPFPSGSRVRFDSPYEDPPPPYEPTNNSHSHDVNSSPRSVHDDGTPPPQVPVSISEPPSAYGSPLIDVDDDDETYTSPEIQATEDVDMSAPPSVMPVIIEETISSYDGVHISASLPNGNHYASSIHSGPSTSNPGASPSLSGFIDPRVYSTTASSVSSNLGGSVPRSSGSFQSPPSLHKRKWEDYATSAAAAAAAAALAAGHPPDPPVSDPHNVFTPHEMAAESSVAAASRRRRESMNATANNINSHHPLHPHHILHSGQLNSSANSLPIPPLVQPQPQHFVHPTSVPLSHHHNIPISHSVHSHLSSHMNVSSQGPPSSTYGIPIPSGAIPTNVSESGGAANPNTTELSMPDIDELTQQVYEDLYINMVRNQPREGTGNVDFSYGQNHPLPSHVHLPFSFDDLRQVLHPWSTRIQSMAHTQYIANLTTKARDAKITELQHRINTLEAELAAQIAISSKYKWERDVMET